jgi:hypothetical protein
MNHSKSKKDQEIKKESQPETPGKATVDRMAYKQCVEQYKRSGSSNPWAMCNAQFGIGKSDAVDMGLDKSHEIQPGMSYAKMQKKEANHIRTDRSSAKKIMAAQKEHMKPTHPQIKGQKPPKVKIKHPVYKTELEPRMSWNELKKIQEEQPLLKKPK